MSSSDASSEDISVAYEVARHTEAKEDTDPFKSFLSGGFGGIAAVLVGQPFDLTKTRLQTAPAGTYTGGLDVVKKTLATDGIRGYVHIQPVCLLRAAALRPPAPPWSKFSNICEVSYSLAR